MMYPFSQLHRAERASCFRAGSKEELVKLYKKPKSKFYWYDFMVRGRRYRGSTHETKSVRALKVASLKLASAIEGTDALPGKPSVLCEFAKHFGTGWTTAGWRRKRRSSTAMAGGY